MEKLLLECIWGALAGYITNEYAIKHIFKDFGPVKSVVSRERASLAESLAAMVEEKILRGPALAEAVNGEKATARLHGLISRAAAGFDKKFNEISGFDSAAELAAELLAELLRGLLSGVALGDLFTASELDAVTERLCSAADIDGLVASLVDENSARTLGDLFPEAGKRLAPAIKKAADDSGVIAAAVNAAADALSGKTLADLTGGDTDRLREEAARLLGVFFASPYCESVIEGLVTELFNWLRGSKLRPADLLPNEALDALDGLAVRFAAAVLPEISGFIDDCDEDIAAILTRAAEHCLGQGLGSPLAGTGFVKELILGFVSDRSAVAKMLCDFVENSLSPEELGKKLASELRGGLLEKSFAELYAEAAERGLPDAAKIARLLARFLGKRAAALPDGLWRQLGGIKLPRLSDGQKRALAERLTAALVAAAEGLMNTPLGKLNVPKLRLPKGESLPLARPLSAFLPPEDKLAALLRELLGGAGKLGISSALTSLLEAGPENSVVETLRERVFGDGLSDLLRIRELIGDKINGMDMPALCALVESYMGENLRPLCLLGAGFGAVIGGGLWGAERLAALPEWASLPVFAMIGVTTNVLALWGLFRPYEKHFGVQGFLPANRADIASKTAAMVERELLNPQLLRENYEKCEPEIRAAMSAAVRERVYAALTSEGGITALARAVTDMLRRTDFSAVGGLKLRPFGRLLEGLPALLAEKADKISAAATRALVGDGSDVAGRSAEFLSKLDAEKAWSALADLKVGSLISTGLCDRAGAALADRLFRPDVGKSAAAKVGSFLASQDGETVGTAFGGAVPRLAARGRGALLDRLKQAILKAAGDNRLKIAEAVGSAVAKKHPIASLLLGAPQLVGGIVDYALANELEPLLDRRSLALGEMTDRLLESFVYPLRPSELRVKGGELKLGGAFEELLSSEERKASAAAALGFVFKAVRRGAAPISVGTYMKLLRADSFAAADALLGGRVSALLDAEREKGAKGRAARAAASFAAEAAPAVKATAADLALLLSKSPAFAAHVCAIAAKAEASDAVLGDIVPKAALRRASRLIGGQPEAKVTAEAERLIQRLALALPPEFVADSADMLASACVGALKEQLGPLLAELDVANITEKSVNSLSGREIKELFDFAKPFFRSIKIWGAAGFLYGINNAVSLAVTVVHFGAKAVEKIFSKRG